jgi:hypothetical protein
MMDAAVVPCGVYHFCHSESGNPAGEADHFLSAVGGLGPDEFPVLDIETGTVLFAARRLSAQARMAAIDEQALIRRWRAHVGAHVRGLATQPDMDRLHEEVLSLSLSWPAFIGAWCPKVRDALGVAPTVYMSESPARSMPGSVAEWPLWVAGYVSSTPTRWEDWRVGPWSSPAMWQFSSSGVVPGVDGRCDVNIAPDDLRARLGLSDPQPPEDDLADPEVLKRLDLINQGIEGLGNMLGRILGAVGVPNGDADTAGGDVNSGANRAGAGLDVALDRLGVKRPTS